jgi:hypothetical protein
MNCARCGSEAATERPEVTKAAKIALDIMQAA